MQLLLGCGRSRKKKLMLPGREAWDGLVTLDMSPDVGADVVHDLCDFPLPFADDSATEIHLYDVLEHTRRQGDWRGFFAEFSEFWRILKHGGLLFAISPKPDGRWAWGDPGHTRVITPECFSFLSQATYAEDLDGEVKSNRTDYRPWYRADFNVLWINDLGEAGYGYTLQAVKPARIK